MSLQAITKSPDFFSRCLLEAEIAPKKFDHIVRKIKTTLHGLQDEEQIRAKLETACKQYPNLLISTSSTSVESPLMHKFVRSKYPKSVLQSCIQVGGRRVLEVGNRQGATVIFHIDSYKYLKRLTDCGAQVNVVYKCGHRPPVFCSVLESYAFAIEIPSIKRCIKHLLGLGACIQENSPLSEEDSTALASVCQEFSGEIATVAEKIKTLTLQFGISTDATGLILDYALGGENAEAYAFIKRYPGVQKRTISIIDGALTHFLPHDVREKILPYMIVPVTEAFT